MTYFIPSPTFAEPVDRGMEKNSLLRNFKIPKMMVAYESALRMNDGPVPNAAIDKPESAGPIMRPELKLAELRLTAFATSFFPTTSALNAMRTGASTALDTPSTKARMNICQICMW